MADDLNLWVIIPVIIFIILKTHLFPKYWFFSLCVIVYIACIFFLVYIVLFHCKALCSFVERYINAHYYYAYFIAQHARIDLRYCSNLYLYNNVYWSKDFIERELDISIYCYGRKKKTFIRQKKKKIIVWLSSTTFFGEGVGGLIFFFSPNQSQSYMEL